MDIQIPPNLQPERGQIPAFVVTAEQADRFRLCFAVGRMITGRDDPLFVRELYDSDIPTGNLHAKVGGQPGLDEHPS